MSEKEGGGLKGSAVSRNIVIKIPLHYTLLKCIALTWKISYILGPLNRLQPDFIVTAALLQLTLQSQVTIVSNF